MHKTLLFVFTNKPLRVYIYKCGLSGEVFIKEAKQITSFMDILDLYFCHMQTYYHTIYDGHNEMHKANRK